MLDFLMISARTTKNGVVEIYPRFLIKPSKDLMIRGSNFYAIWLEEIKQWSTQEYDAINEIDRLLEEYSIEYSRKNEGTAIRVLYLWDSDSGSVDKWIKYTTRQLGDNYKQLDEKLIFLNTERKREDYSSKSLPYALEEGPLPAYNHLSSVLYSKEEKTKIDWIIGSIVSGESKTLQKFMVLYGSAGTGKSTILNIIQMLFEGYYTVFDSKALGSNSSAFALESFSTNPLVGIQHDGDLSRIEDNTKLNSLVSHEMMPVNEKYKSLYFTKFNSILLMGTNKPVKITDAKSGLIRRLIDVTPSGNKLTAADYKNSMNVIKFELGAIAYYCLQVYLSDPGKYDNYIPINMMGASNDFYNFMSDNYQLFEESDETTLKQSWELYKVYCEETRMPYPLPQRQFKEELKNYFKVFKERSGTLRNLYSEFIKEKFFDGLDAEEAVKKTRFKKIVFKEDIPSIFDEVAKEYDAQYATKDGVPYKKWAEVTTKLQDLNTKKLHYVKVPENHIVIDFDIKDADGKKDFQANLDAASRWPDTYAELSKSGAGIHLHYIYVGDPSMLSRIYDDEIEIKVFKGDASLRRMLTKCNDIPINVINSGLPLKGEDYNKKGGDFITNMNEKGLRTFIKRNLNKEYHASTAPSISFINKVLEDAYNSGIKYNVSDLRLPIIEFASSSTNQALICIKIANNMKFMSKHYEEDPNFEDGQPHEKDSKIVIFDVEVYPNVNMVCYKLLDGKGTIKINNPTPKDIEEMLRYRLIGFNNRRYDNHILYAIMLGYSPEQVYEVSRRIISGDKYAFFGEAYSLSYLDIYDMSTDKKSLKKWEIELGFEHKEVKYPWDEPLDPKYWGEVIDYCTNDVIATEGLFKHLKEDFIARQILADIAGMPVNTSTNTLTTKFIFGNDKNPQEKFNYRFMGDLLSEEEQWVTDETLNNLDALRMGALTDDEYSIFDINGRPHFPGYKFERGVSTYRGETVGEGGYVYAEPGIHINVGLFDVASMHPTSIIKEELFGKEYTQRFKEIYDARLAIKHRDISKARTLLNGALDKYLNNEENLDGLAFALKIAINSVYGLTSARFENAFRDPRNIDNIVAKRGALFMINLKYEVQKRGYTVAHIKTDSIKIPNFDENIKNFIFEYGKKYGYSFEHEATYEKMFLANDSIYVTKYAWAEKQRKIGTWEAVGTQFQVPYVFKTLFTKEKMIFEDFCETKAVKTALYLDMNESLPDVSKYEAELVKAKRANPQGDYSELEAKIAEGHNYIFVGKVGRFCPIEDGVGAGLLMRSNDSGGYGHASGTKGYRWMESEMVKVLKLEDKINKKYYTKLVDDAVDAIAKYGDVDIFTS